MSKLTVNTLFVTLIVLSGCQHVEPTAEIDLDSLHAQALVIDAHADIEIPGNESRYVGEDGKSKVSLEKMQAGGVDAVVMSIAVGPMAGNTCVPSFWKHLTQAHST